MSEKVKPTCPSCDSARVLDFYGVRMVCKKCGHEWGSAVDLREASE